MTNSFIKNISAWHLWLLILIDKGTKISIGKTLLLMLSACMGLKGDYSRYENKLGLKLLLKLCNQIEIFDCKIIVWGIKNLNRCSFLSFALFRICNKNVNCSVAYLLDFKFEKILMSRTINKHCGNWVNIVLQFYYFSLILKLGYNELGPLGLQFKNQLFNLALWILDS